MFFYRLIHMSANMAIRAYQSCISPAFGTGCKYIPSCSEYTVKAIERHGIAKGCAMGIRRLLKCNPFEPGGYDPLPYDK